MSGRPIRWQALAEVVADAVGDGFCEAGLERRGSQQGGFSAVRQIAHLDQYGGAASSDQNLVVCRLSAVAAETGSRH